jgi:hypothetical protein
VTQRVTGGMLGNPDLGRGRFDDPLEDRWVQVMAPCSAVRGFAQCFSCGNRNCQPHSVAAPQWNSESGPERHREPTPSGLLQRASRGGALARSLLPTQRECQVAEQTAENGVPTVTCARLHFRQAYAFICTFGNVMAYGRRDGPDAYCGKSRACKVDRGKIMVENRLGYGLMVNSHSWPLRSTW